MYSWRTIRIVCTILLLMPIVHLVYMISSETLATLNASPEVWAHEIDAYAKRDRSNKLPQDPIVIVGGHRLKLWQGLENLLAPNPVLVRGLGDATVSDIIHNYERLIGYYRPRALVFLPGNSEFHVRDNKSAEEFVRAVQKFEKLDRDHGITRYFYIFTPLKTPLYPQDSAKISAITMALKVLSESNKRMRVLDANPLLQGADGSPDPGFYRSDGVNLNEHGYLRLSVLLQEAVGRDPLAPEEGEANP